MYVCVSVLSIICISQNVQVELHVHLDGSFDSAVLFRAAQKHLEDKTDETHKTKLGDRAGERSVKYPYFESITLNVCLCFVYIYIIIYIITHYTYNIISYIYIYIYIFHEFRLLPINIR